MNTKEQLIELRSHKPFRPFRIALSDGRSFTLRSPGIYGIGFSTLGVSFESGGHEQIPISSIVAIDQSLGEQAALIEKLGTFDSIITPHELESLRGCGSQAFAC